MQVVKYIQRQYPAIIQEMKFTPSIGELKKDFESEVMLRDEIMRIAASYLSLNIKSKSINSDAGLMLVVDFILEECSNLELQEINFIFKSGIMGKFGVIYNDISIDTICGKKGWIETYYKDFRKLRPEKKQEEVIRLTGKEMTEDELFSKDENYKDFRKTITQARTGRVSIEDAVNFLKANHYNFNYEIVKIKQSFEKSKIDGYERNIDDFISEQLARLIVKIRTSQIKLIDIYKRSLLFKTTIEDAKQFYLIKGLSLNDFKDDFQFYSKEYQNQELIKGEMLYITERFRKFIVENVFKNKK